MPKSSVDLSILTAGLPMGSRAGEATKKCKQDIADGQHRQDIEKAKQQDNRSSESISARLNAATSLRTIA